MRGESESDVSSAPEFLIAKAHASYCLYADLFNLDILFKAYDEIKEKCRDFDIDAVAFKVIETSGAEAFLHQLSSDLQNGDYRGSPRTIAPDPAKENKGDRFSLVRNLVVQVAIQTALTSSFPVASRIHAQPEKALDWLAGYIEKGLTHVGAINFGSGLDAKGDEQLLQCVSRKIDDHQMLGLLREVLAASSEGQPHGSPDLVRPLLVEIACEDMDEILQQAMAFGQEGNYRHIQCARLGKEIVFAADRDPRFEWIFPALLKRLHEELAHLHCERADLEVQSLDLLSGVSLRALGHELSCTRDKSGALHVEYHPLTEAEEGQNQETVAHFRWLGRYNPLRWLQPVFRWLNRWRLWRLLSGVSSKISGIKVEWRHLPITLLPVFMVFFGWKSLVALVGLVAIFLCNWCWFLLLGHAVGRRSKWLYEGAKTIQVGWRHLSVTLFPILLILFTWRSAVPWVCLALIFVCNWQWTIMLTRWAGRHKLDLLMGGCATAALLIAYPSLDEIYATRPREVAVASDLPEGFYLGEYYGPSWWYGEPAPRVRYGLYLPPNLRHEKGPYPLIVFLHGYGERTEWRIFEAGLPRAIARQGYSQFAAFFPIDPKGEWQAGSPEVDHIMKALEHVSARHNIDPARIYLTGLSIGGSGVWNLAEAYPHQWAAVAPVCSFDSPDVDRVKHLPAWIFHGAKDQMAPVERERLLVKRLQEVGAEVRYTELPNKGHGIWPDAYNPRELYDWFAQKEKN